MIADESSFADAVLASPLPVLVEFWGSWCPPCKMMDPLLAALEAEYAGKVRIVKVNADQNPALAAAHDVRGLPALMVFVAGQVTERRIGAQTRNQLVKLLDAAAGGAAC